MYEDALLERGYTPLLCVGVGTRDDGTPSVKLAAGPVIRTFTPEQWTTLRTTIIGALDRLVTGPMDDLEHR